MIDVKEKPQAKIAARVRTRLENHPIVGERALWLANVSSLSRAQIFRKLKGHSPWSMEDLIKTAQAINCPLQEFLQDFLDAEPKPTESALTGLTVIDGVLFRCHFRIGQPGIGLSAIKGDSTWRITATVKHASAEEISQLVILGPADRPRPLVLIIDNDRSFANNLCDELENYGYSAITLSPALGLEDKLHRFDYIDAFIIDWDAGQYGGEHLIEITCTSRHAQAPIILLVDKEQDEDNHITNTVNSFSVHSFKKHVPTTTLISALDRLLNRTHPHATD